MLHESELRPGNFIYYNGRQAIIDSNAPGMLFMNEPVLPAQNNAQAYSGDILHDADGIPLTEEWLVKFAVMGRDPSGNVYKKLPNAHFATINKCMQGYQVMTNRGSRHLMFVHEYQNWWKETTGEDLVESAQMITTP